MMQSGGGGGGNTTNYNPAIKESSSRTHLVQAHTWFAARPEFQMHKQAIDADADDPDWALI